MSRNDPVQPTRYSAWLNQGRKAAVPTIDEAVLSVVVPRQTERTPRACVVSMRNLFNLVSRTADYRFEDLIGQIDDVDVISIEPRPSFEQRRRVVNRVAGRFSNPSLNPGVHRNRLDRRYDLFFAKCLLPNDLLMLKGISNWRENCGIAVCWLSEVFADDLERLKTHVEVLSQFDYILLNFSNSVQALETATGTPCHYVAPGIDALLFSPHPAYPERSIDVYSLGRRSPVTHRALLELADAGRIFYMYDTIDRMHSSHPMEHRALVANIAKRSKYFIANPVKVNRPGETKGQIELGYRFLEGAAAGTIMIGETPDIPAFTENFDWPDSLIHVPYDTEDISAVLDDLEGQSERLEKARVLNVTNSLRRHDWAHRWRSILDLAGLEPTRRHLARETGLENLAVDLEKRGMTPRASLK